MSRPEDRTPGDGTPDDAEQQSGGTQDDAPDDAGDDKGKLIKTLQDNTAAAKREAEEARAEAARLKAELETARAGGNATNTTGMAGELISQEHAALRYMASLQAAANDPNDPNHAYAAFEVRKTQAQLGEIQSMRTKIDLLEVPEAERAGVRKEYESGNYRNLEAARKAYLGGLSDEEREKIRPRPKREASPREREEIVDTGTRPLSAVGVEQRRYKRGEWERAWDAASARGDDNKLEELRRNIPRD